MIWFTLSFALLATFVGFALDFGRAYLEKARIARLVDGAAIVAAKIVQGQVGNEDAATRAACDSMTMNGAPVVMSGSTTCTATAGAPFTATIAYLPKAVAGWTANDPRTGHGNRAGADHLSTISGLDGSGRLFDHQRCRRRRSSAGAAHRLGAGARPIGFNAGNQDSGFENHRE